MPITPILYSHTLGKASLCPVWPDKKRQMSMKVAQKWFHMKNDDFDTLTKIA